MNRVTYLAARSLASVSHRVYPRDKTIHGTRVLMFHDLNMEFDTSDLYSLPKSVFEAGMSQLAEWMNTNNRPAVPFSETPRPGIAITFDDGYKSTLTVAAPLLASLGIPFHVFLTQSYVEGTDPRFLRKNDLKELCALPGVSVGIHGVTHRRLTSLTASEVSTEIRGSRDWLEQLVGQSVTSLSYPHGDFNNSVAELARASGMSCAACSHPGTFSTSGQQFAIPRIDIWSLDTAPVFLQKSLGAWDALLPK